LKGYLPVSLEETSTHPINVLAGPQKIEETENILQNVFLR